MTQEVWKHKGHRGKGADAVQGLEPWGLETWEGVEQRALASSPVWYVRHSLPLISKNSAPLPQRQLGART